MWRDYLKFMPTEHRGAVDSIVDEHIEWRGMSIHLNRLRAPDAPARMMLVHGAGAYGRIIMLLATKLGLELVAPDLPGYGLSDPRGRSVTYQDWEDCVTELAERERERDARPFILLGGSMGGLLAYSAAARAGADGLIATCFLDPRDPEVLRHMTRTPSLTPLLGVVPDRLNVPIRWLTHMDRMSNDPELGALCARDPMGGGGRVSIGWLRSFLSSSPPVEPRDFRACPVLLVHPGADTWTPLAISRPFFDALTVEKQLVVLENAGHFPIEEPGITQLDAAVRAFVDQRS